MIDVEDDPAGVAGPFELGARGTVEALVDLGPLQQLVALHQRKELLTGDEVVFAPILLAVTRRARGVRDAEYQLGYLFEQPRGQCRLAGPGGGGDDER